MVEETAKMDDDWIFQMLNIVEGHPLLWFRQQTGKKTKKCQDSEWNAVAAELEAIGVKKSGDDIKKEWNHIRDAWCKQQSKPAGEIFRNSKNRKYFGSLDFLRGKSSMKRSASIPNQSAQKEKKTKPKSTTSSEIFLPSFVTESGQPRTDFSNEPKLDPDRIAEVRQSLLDEWTGLTQSEEFFTQERNEKAAKQSEAEIGTKDRGNLAAQKSRISGKSGKLGQLKVHKSNVGFQLMALHFMEENSKLQAKVAENDHLRASLDWWSGSEHRQELVNGHETLAKEWTRLYNRAAEIDMELALYQDEESILKLNHERQVVNIEMQLVNEQVERKKQEIRIFDLQQTVDSLKEQNNGLQGLLARAQMDPNPQVLDSKNLETMAIARRY